MTTESSGTSDGSTQETISRIMWRTDNWMHCFHHYSTLVSLMTTNLSIIKHIGDFLDPSEFDSFANVAVNILHKCDRALPLIALLVNDELKASTSAGKGSVFRGNSFVSAMEKAFVKLVAKDFLTKTVGDTIRHIIDDKELDLEIDPAKLGADVDQTVIASRLQTLSDFVTSIVTSITNETCIESMPRELRCVLSILSTSARQYMPDMMLQILNGFIILRVFSPALVTPESVGIVPVDMAPADRPRRNLILVAKVLQSIGNFGASVGKKEQYMDPLKPYIDGQIPVLTAFLESLAQPYPGMDSSYLSIAESPDDLPYKAIDVRDVSLSDLFELHRVLHSTAAKFLPLLIAATANQKPQASRGVRSTISLGEAHLLVGAGNTGSASQNAAPLLLHPSPNATAAPAAAAAESVINTSLSPTSTTPGSSPTNVVTASPPSPSSAVVPQATTVSTFQPAKPKMMANSASASTRNSFVYGATRRVSWQASLLSIMPQLGPPPVFSHQNTLVDIDATASATSSSSTSSPTSTSAPPASAAANATAAAMEAAKFLYLGPSSSKCGSIFYFILTRFDVKLIDSMPSLIAYVTKTMDAAVHSGGYTLVVDLSWSTISQEGRQLVYSNLRSFWEMFPRMYKKNLRQVVILQPNKFFHTVFSLLKQFISKKAHKKFVEVYDWKHLAPVLGVSEESVVIPESSKHNSSKVYRVVKVNAHGKKQERLIKFTTDSLLNLDPHATRIHNEKLLSQIDEISIASPKSLEIFMRFLPDDKAKKKKGVFNSLLKASHDDIRTYICSTLAERDAILQDLFASAFRCGYSPGRQEYQVVKVNRVGKRQERTFKLTVDSLMNIANSEIRHEMCFAGIDAVKPDEQEKNLVWLKYKSETLWRQIYMEDSAAFIKALQEGLYRYRVDQGY